MSLFTVAALALALTSQLVKFLTATIVLLLGSQGRFRRRHQRNIPPGDSSKRAGVISGFAHGDGLGRMRWQGQTWAAVSTNAVPVHRPCAEALVMGREGNRLRGQASKDP